MKYGQHTRTKTQIELSYIAGIVDGEGSITVNKDKRWNAYRLRFDVTNTDLRMINFIKDHFGGWVFKYESPLGKTWRIRYRYSITGGKKLEPILRAILPYLICKKAQAELGIEFIERMKKGEKTTKFGEFYFNKMKALNDYRPEFGLETSKRVGLLEESMRCSELGSMVKAESSPEMRLPLN